MVQSHFFNLHIKYASERCPRLSKPSSSSPLIAPLPFSLSLSPSHTHSSASIYIRVSMIHSADLACSFSCGRQPVQTRAGGGGEGGGGWEREHTAALLMQLVKKSISQGRRKRRRRGKRWYFDNRRVFAPRFESGGFLQCEHLNAPDYWPPFLSSPSSPSPRTLVRSARSLFAYRIL